MTGEPPLQRVGVELHELERLLSGGSEDSKTSLGRIFSINNAIGITVRSQPELEPQMFELQSWVNLITMGVKSSDREKVRNGIQGSLRVFQNIANAGPQKNL